ncbi:MAG: 3'(2'),5'-bisphosphate nucleotidase CysQ [Bacilli bacterium]|nr:3'(2'),5'-bisphosphate nucleotidase CysQ [Bacilli bacterium]MCH4210789.1 3'(2'),5'-bisphosphate nucleotidase CysQ [Bacilli bacterium]MCI2055313.1 3'(2'),5'-bisphosphate nucleotidase CysQ [Bacilli bacterium]
MNKGKVSYMWEKELKSMIKAAYDAEVKIKEVYSKPFEVEIKSDNSPVTAADKGADSMIRKELHESFPSYAFLTEESKDDKSRLLNDYVFIVDPVDGTKEFVSRNGEFCTNIALSYKHEIVVGVINIPMQNVLYYAVKGEGAYKLERGGTPVRIHVDDKTDAFTVLRSKSFFTEGEKILIEKHKDKIARVISKGAALKFCEIAEGKAELSYRESPGTKEWDIAAGQIIIMEAGGYILKHDGSVYTFNRDDVYNHDPYVLVNRKENILL